MNADLTIELQANLAQENVVPKETTAKDSVGAKRKRVDMLIDIVMNLCKYTAEEVIQMSETEWNTYIAKLAAQPAVNMEIGIAVPRPRCRHPYSRTCYDCCKYEADRTGYEYAFQLQKQFDLYNRMVILAKKYMKLRIENNDAQAKKQKLNL